MKQPDSLKTLALSHFMVFVPFVENVNSYKVQIIQILGSLLGIYVKLS